MSTFRKRLLATTLPVSVERPVCNTTTASTKPQPTAAEIMAACQRLLAEPRPRWAGGGMPGITIEADEAMPSGWFGLREPGAATIYAGPLPIASFGIFYRGGDVVRLSPRDARRALDQGKGEGGGDEA